MNGRETFSSRFGLLVAGLGMAIGTGNMWRFPRIIAQNGGAVFLIPWFIFLFTWSLPLLIAEFGIGRAARRGVIGAFAHLFGRGYAWMGGFIAVTSVMILFYYSVVTGWTLKYALGTLTGQITGSTAEQYWTNYSSSIWQPLFFHVVSIAIGALIVSRGVVAGIERANKVLIPTLLGLLLIAVIRSITLQGSDEGISFLFSPDLSLLWNHRTWLEALTQSAWSTGAGWGLILTYAIYIRDDEDVSLSAAAIGIGNNTASVLAGVAIVPIVFTVLSEGAAAEAMAAGNIGLTFVWIPKLFVQIPFGNFFLPLFFVALFCAALSSLIAMIELATRVLMDGGMDRKLAVGLVAAATTVGGAPSAVSLTIFENQDWVWSLALMISGLCIAFGVIKFGVRRFRETLVNVADDNFRLGPYYDWVLTYLIPIEFAAMFAWWIYQAVVVVDPTGWWDPLGKYSLGACLVQWGFSLGLLFAFNKRIAAASLRK